LGLLALNEVSSDALVLQRAVDCGRHILAAYRPGPTHPLCGFSHGAAGIAYALLRLYGATGEAAFFVAAQEAIVYEASVFVGSEGNWPDLRPAAPGRPGAGERQAAFRVAWCHGAAGIGLARLGGLPWLDTPAVRRDLDVALKATQDALAAAADAANAAGASADADHLCCGQMGRIELLLAAGERLGRPALVEAARRQAAWVVAQAEQLGGYRLSSVLPRGVHSPGFFQGAAGLGYELLRLADPERLPSVLLWHSSMLSPGA
jgi:lantibiotic modifying enzyme